MFNEKTNKYEGYIYCISNRNNFKNYIGQTTRTIEERFKSHKYSSKNLKRSIYLYSDVKDYGWSLFDIFEVEKIESNSLSELKDLLNQREIFYISNYNTLYPNGYNISKGGWILNNTFESCKVYKFDVDENLVAVYESMADAAINNHLSQADISNCCKGKKLVTVGGFYWSKKPEFPSHLKNRKHKKKVAMYDLNENFIKEFDSISDAAVEMFDNAKKRDAIVHCLKGKSKTSYGYIWKYAE